MVSLSPASIGVMPFPFSGLSGTKLHLPQFWQLQVLVTGYCAKLQTILTAIQMPFD